MVHGVVSSMPFIGIALTIGVFALAGSPPFSIFFSELLILISGFMKGAYISTGIFLAVIASTFGAMIYHFSKMLFGKKPDDMDVSKTGLGAGAVFILLLVIIVSFGLCMPSFLNNVINSAVNVLIKGS